MQLGVDHLIEAWRTDNRVNQTVAYFIAHKSHHRGNILLTLKQTGHRLDPKLRHAIRDWDGI